MYNVVGFFLVADKSWVLSAIPHLLALAILVLVGLYAFYNLLRVFQPQLEARLAPLRDENAFPLRDIRQFSGHYLSAPNLDIFSPLSDPRALVKRMSATLQSSPLQPTVHAPSPRMQRLLSHCPLLMKFHPTIWASNKHIQTGMFAFWIPPTQMPDVFRLTFKREIIKSSEDGGAIPLDWWISPAAKEDAPILLIFPGVIGHSTDLYPRRMAAFFATRLGFRTAVKGWRGLGAPLTTRRPETWSKTAVQDALDAIRGIRKECGSEVPIFAVGFSFGGNLVQSVLGSYKPEEHTLMGGVSLSGTFDFDAMLTHIMHNPFPPYDYFNTLSVKNDLSSHLPTLLPEEDERQRFLQASNHMEYHERMTIKFTGHKDVSEYKKDMQALAEEALRNVSTPLLSLMAEDDPLCPANTACVRAMRIASRNPHILTVVTKYGGHCGWFWGAKGESWADEVCESFFLALLEEAGMQHDAAPQSCSEPSADGASGPGLGPPCGDDTLESPPSSPSESVESCLRRACGSPEALEEPATDGAEAALSPIPVSGKDKTE